jgi:multidrug resistance efflux pump
LGKSKIDAERDTPLAQKKAIPKGKLDNEVQAKLAAEAAVAAGNAEVERAELDLRWTTAVAFDQCW